MRDWPVTGVDSDPDIMVGGVVVWPTDFSPEPDNATKQNLLKDTDYEGVTKLLQGSGVVSPKYPMLMWRFAMQVRPEGSGLQARIQEIAYASK